MAIGGEPEAYGAAFADVYDDWYPSDDHVPVIVDRLASLAGTGAVLELGVGTGRLALPLAERRVPVWGIDASAAMLRRLAVKDEGQRVRTVITDMAVLTLPDGAPTFSLVFAAFNTFYLLTTERAQRCCLRRCREVLGPDGRLAMELYTPAPSSPGHHRWTDTVRVADDTLQTAEYQRSPADPRLFLGRTFNASSSRRMPRRWALRPLPLAELDAMAAGAGLELEFRWRNWAGDRYFDRFGEHVSVWRAA